MKKEALKIILTISGAILFNIIFWQEKLAVNALIFDAFILWSVFYLYPSSFSHATVKWLLAGHLITLAAVVIHNTELSKLAFSITLMLLVVFVQYLHRSVWYAAASVVMNYIMMAPSFAGNLFSVKVKGIRAYSFYKSFRFIIIPLALAAVFFIIYSFANAVFRDMMNDAAIALQNFFNRFFDWFSWDRFGFFMLGLFITGGLLLKRNKNILSEKDNLQKEEMLRKRTNFSNWKESVRFDILSLFMGRFANGNLALKNENTIGLISLALLNVMLLCINCIDIVYVWFGYNHKYNMNLSDYVHEGTWLLIFSIVLAMSILLFFFRGNLNFYKRNKWLKYGAYGWIFQNMILVISVLIRDYDYIALFGLAYKRIGVLFFLLMVLAGLITVLIKIRYLKTNYYLLKVNAWFAVVLLVISSCIHWDEFIADYNLARKSSVKLDVAFLLSLSDKALPVIEKNQDVLDDSIIAADNQKNESNQSLTEKDLFNYRKKEFFEKQKSYSWLSWNEADEYVKKNIRLNK